MTKYFIDVFRKRDLDEVLALHEIAFASIDEPKFQEWLREDLKARKAFVARLEDYVIGFASYTFMKDDSYSKRNIQFALGWARDKANEPQLLKLMERRQEELGKGEASAIIYENELTKGNIDVLGIDMYLSELAVHPKFRWRGIGKALTRERIRLAKELKSSAIYVNCWEGNTVSKMYEKLGFLPILRMGPEFKDGSAEKEMGLLLKI